MKAFWFSISALALLIGAILLNAVYVGRVTDKLHNDLTALPPCEQASDASQALATYWAQAEPLLTLSVSAQDMTDVSDHIAELCTAARFKDEEAFEQARALCLLAIARIRDLERFSFLHIL